MKPLVITNFKGQLTRYDYGDINSGFAKYSNTFNVDPYSKPNSLRWFENAVRIDPNGGIITDLIVAGKERVESGNSYIYAIGHTGRLYKIQVNDVSSLNPNLDSPTLLAVLSINSPTFKRGGFIDFYGATEKIYIGHDKGVTSINFDGTGEAFVGSVSSWTADVPRPFKQFLGKLYVGNGSNLAEIDSTGTVTSYQKLSPSFPSNYQVRDIDTDTEGLYLEAVVTRLPLTNILDTSVDTTYMANLDSYLFRWDGVNAGASSFNIFSSFSLNANHTFQRFKYLFGYDLTGCAVFSGQEKILTPVLTQAPLPNAIASNANIIGWMSPEFYNGFLRASLFAYGSLDNEVSGYWRQYAHPASGGKTDIIRVPYMQIVSNFIIGSVVNGYNGGVTGLAKLYFSTMESDGTNIDYKFFKFYLVSAGLTSVSNGVYETQSQLFSKKVKIGEVRLYVDPLASGVSFKVDLIGAGGSVIPNSTKTFTVGSNVSANQDYIWYQADIAPTYVLGVRISNLGTVNWTLNKMEIDYQEGGK